GGALEVILGAGADFAEDNFLGSAATEQAANAREQFSARGEELLGVRQLHGVAQGGAAARDNADFVNRISAFALGSDERMADFVICDAALLLFAQAAALALGAGDDFLDGFLEVALFDAGRLAAGSEKGGFVHGVGEV